MTLLSATSISKIYKDQTILKDVSFSLESSHRIGLVGKNGIGKTTLLEMLAGKISCDTGNITRSRQCRIDYVEQEKTEYLDQSLFEFVAAARQDLLDQRTEIHELELYLAERPSDDTAVTKLGQLQETFEAGGGFDFENEIGIILTGLGFDRDRYSERMRNFSGGEKNRAGLARLLAGNGNLLLLDEPTNHLDIESTAWLEDYLRKIDRAYIVVSHDRAFLANTVDEIWEIGLGKIERYTGGFENYLRERDERRRLAAHHYRHQQEEIKRIEEFIRRNMAGQKTKQAQSKLKYLGRMKRLPPPRTDGSGPVIKVTSSGRSFAHVLSCHDASLGYGDTTVLSDVSFDLYRGEKVGVIGRNGSGKSTLLKSLIGELEPERGNVKLGSNIEVAYFDQDLADLNLESSVLDSVWELDPVADAHTIRSFLARFGFTGEDAFKKVMSLSGGEKTKLCLARLLYRPANFIILDEPTNHLDIDSRFALEKALKEYDGTLLMVSHDRFFLQSVANRILYVCDGETSMYDGNYAYFTERRALAEQTTEGPKEKKGKQAYLDFKEQSRRRSRHKKNIQSTRDTIEQKEVLLGELESQLNGVIPADDWQKLQEVSKRKQDTEHEILELYIRLEQLEAEELD